MARCVYCLDDKALLLVCMQCRTKLEAAKRDQEWHKQMAAIQRKNVFRLTKENERLRAAVSKLSRKVK